MAKQVLPVNFKDDLLAESMDGKRKYRMIDNGDGTVSLEDVSEYLQTGSTFGAGQINSTNQAVNDSVDKDKILKTLEEVSASTDSDAVAGRGAVAELNKNMQFPDNVGFYPDIKDGVRGYNTDAARGADTFFPFSVGEIEYINSIAMVYEQSTIQHHKIYFDETYNDYTRLLVIAPLGNASSSPTLVVPNGTIEFDKTVSQSGSKWVNDTLVSVDTYVNMCVISDFNELEYLDYQYGGTGIVTCYVFGIK